MVTLKLHNSFILGATTKFDHRFWMLVRWRMQSTHRMYPAAKNSTQYLTIRQTTHLHADLLHFPGPKKPPKLVMTVKAFNLLIMRLSCSLEVVGTLCHHHILLHLWWREHLFHYCFGKEHDVAWLSSSCLCLLSPSIRDPREKLSSSDRGEAPNYLGVLFFGGHFGARPLLLIHSRRNTAYQPAVPLWACRCC